MNIRSEDIKEVLIGVPEGHRHIRTKIVLNDNTEIILQEAAMSNILRGFITVKTHPVKRSVLLIGQRIGERKAGYAEWQLLDE